MHNGAGLGGEEADVKDLWLSRQERRQRLGVGWELRGWNVEERTGFGFAGRVSLHTPQSGPQALKPTYPLLAPHCHHEQDPWPLSSYWFGAMGGKMMSVVGKVHQT